MWFHFLLPRKETKRQKEIKRPEGKLGKQLPQTSTAAIKCQSSGTFSLSLRVFVPRGQEDAPGFPTLGTRPTKAIRPERAADKRIK
jgi:hypothetical protein